MIPRYSESPRVITLEVIPVERTDRGTIFRVVAEEMWQTEHFFLATTVNQAIEIWSKRVGIESLMTNDEKLEWVNRKERATASVGPDGSKPESGFTFTTRDIQTAPMPKPTRAFWDPFDFDRPSLVDRFKGLFRR